MLLDSCNAIDNGIDVNKRASIYSRGVSTGLPVFISHKAILWVSASCLLLACDKAEQIWLASVEIWVLEVPQLGLGLGPEHALL